ncbi:pyridoxamine 5'-phosphate oxidase family protein [Gordonia sp. TBRC 11910]|uniref:Pyridoxamine 5'-phosphate oxidase family protein n=1 Tax=Gordonia asplenii TaxID=2725283 RepID=A0A848KSK8_9ACTN|nr:pyridoxamine 5'-phosphate oxidase family protein [Gordonia asplenii]NMO01252.1 pyridoxamine 5'-phosphate oxidase family protein [Gordonia asplenii]
MNPQPDTRTQLDWPSIAAQATSFIATEYASVSRDGTPVTWPVTPYSGTDRGTVDISTGLTYPLKAERARRNPKVALSFSEPTGSGLDAPATFVIQGYATVRDADLRANSARYLAQSAERFPDLTASTPDAVMRRMAWYWTRIWVEVTPVRVLWWPGGDLTAAPQVWEPASPFDVPASDPAPGGRGAGSWNCATPEPWQRKTLHAIEALGLPVLTVVDDAGWPLPLRMRAAQRTDFGFRLTPPNGVTIPDGAACLTFHTHAETFDSQSNVGVIGTCRWVGESVEFHAERLMQNFDVPRNPLRRAVHMLSAGRKLKRRLDSEAQRRGQRVPRYEELGR